MESLCLDADGRKTIANEFAARTRGLSVTEELPKRPFKLLILLCLESNFSFGPDFFRLA